MTERPLAWRSVNLLFIATLAGFLLFAWLTEMGDIGLGSARYPERWDLWRYLIVPAWLAIAYGLCYAVDRKAWRESLVSSLLSAGLLSFVLAGSWIGMSSGYAILGSAAAYTLIASLLSMLIKRSVVAAIIAAILVIVQILVDIVILGFAGEFRIH